MTAAAIDPSAFRSAFAQFQSLVLKESGHPFVTFQDGMVADWENYKPILRDYTLGLLRPETWWESEIGGGVILERMIEAFEIQVDHQRKNNLVFWQNRFGHPKRDHRVFLEARTDARLRRENERLLYGCLPWQRR